MNPIILGIITGLFLGELWRAANRRRKEPEDDHIPGVGNMTAPSTQPPEPVDKTEEPST